MNYIHVNYFQEYLRLKAEAQEAFDRGLSVISALSSEGRRLEQREADLMAACSDALKTLCQGDCEQAKKILLQALRTTK